MEHVSPSVLLLAGLASNEHRSMDRYARELFAALHCAAGASRSISFEQPIPHPYVSRLLDHPQARRIDSAWFRYVAYPRSLRARQAGVYHILDHGYAQLIRVLDSERTVITCHDVIPLLAAEGVIPIHVPATVKRTFRARIAYLTKARAVIAVSAATRDTLARYTPVRPDRIVVVPNGVSSTFRVIPDVGARRRASAGLDLTSRVLLHVATPSRYKNTPVLLRAFAELRTRVPDVVLVRVGSSFYPDEAALADRLGVSHAIKYVGIVPDLALAEWYNAADLLAFPSLWEGFGWPPLEAMACGTPVVASHIPAIAEVTGDSAVLVAPDDPAALAAAVERVLTDRTCAASLRQKGLERAGHFSWAATAARTLAVYDSMLG